MLLNAVELQISRRARDVVGAARTKPYPLSTSYHHLPQVDSLFLKYLSRAIKESRCLCEEIIWTIKSSTLFRQVEVSPVARRCQFHDNKHRFSQNSEEKPGAKQTLQNCTRNYEYLILLP